MSQPAPNLVLIGLRASGKTTLGQALAGQLRWTFVDTDVQLAQKHNQPIADLFERLGEPAFREAEHQVLLECQHLRRHVISTGGGAILRADNRDILRLLGPCIWLDASVEVLQQRVAAAPGSRPALHGDDPVEEISRVRQDREPLYAELASMQLDTGSNGTTELVQQILVQTGLAD